MSKLIDKSLNSTALSEHFPVDRLLIRSDLYSYSSMIAATQGATDAKKLTPAEIEYVLGVKTPTKSNSSIINKGQMSMIDVLPPSSRLLMRLLSQFPFLPPPSRKIWDSAFDELVELKHCQPNTCGELAPLLGLSRSTSYAKNSGRKMDKPSGSYFAILIQEMQRTQREDVAYKLLDIECSVRGIDTASAIKKGWSKASPDTGRKRAVYSGLYCEPITGEHFCDNDDLLPIQKNKQGDLKFRYLFGLTRAGFTELKNTLQPENIRFSYALLMRAMLSFPELIPLPRPNEFVLLKKRLQKSFPEKSRIKFDRKLYMALGYSASIAASDGINEESPERGLLHMSYALNKCLDHYGVKFWGYYLKNFVDADAQIAGFKKGEIFNVKSWNPDLIKREE